MDFEDRIKKFKELRKMKLIKRPNPSSEKSIGVITQFYSRIDDAKNKLSNGIDVGNTQAEQVAKMSKKAHIAHELFVKQFKDFRIKSRNNLRSEDIRDFMSNVRKNISKSYSLEKMIDV